MLHGAWWAWMSAALLLATAEVIVPGWIFLSLAVGALVVGGLLLLGMSGVSLPVTLLTFAAFSLIAYLVFRRVLKVKTGQTTLFDPDRKDS